MYSLVMYLYYSFYQEVKSDFIALESELSYGLALADGILENGAQLGT